MSTVAEIIRDALGYLRVLDANEAAEAEDATTAMRMLNLMMHSWQANNLALGWHEVTNPTDILPAPKQADIAIACNLAVLLAARYGAPLDQAVIDHARYEKANLISAAIRAEDARMTYDLPRPAQQRARAIVEDDS
ncbi:hypothetical protein B398_04205 [Xylella fastidiosa 32]|uniref:hypothetical protein n=1 Tax=Xylella fastidiosa TaxID=2371 RepID=UPI0003D340A8|nr:hypothetical protein [Xylella fastidiosa]ALQ96693.1 hypothetical protein XFC3_04060 [Xylella fastidiosa]ETE33422.1 hypothetical protein B398_04205 [Xylella fastidiosa 32]KXB19937.1 hypothetical protein ADT30_08460 [Xylella fastidiosa]